MEIISYVLSGALEHKDSMGNGSVSYPGDVQLMRAGTGVTHSEYNPSDKSVVHFLQIWILPSEKGLEPGYQQRHFRAEERRNALRLVASRDGCEGSVRVHQDAEMYTALLDEGAAVTHRLPTGRHAWLQVAVGAVRCNGIATAAGDGAAVNGETTVNIIATGPSEVIFFDIA